MSETPSADDHTPAEQLDYIVEFGEPVYLRPRGCPVCDDEWVTVDASQCSNCDATFEPYRPV